MSIPDQFAGLLSTGQWITAFIVVGLIFGVMFAIVDSEGEPGGAFLSGLLLPFAMWLLVMLVCHFVNFLVDLWKWDFAFT